MTRGLMRSVIAGAIALVLAVAMAGGSLPLLTGTANAAPPQDGVYQIYRPIFSDSTWTLTFATVTAVDNTLGVTVVYQNNSAADQGLYCPDTKQSLLVNGQTVTELTSYCAQNIGRIWTVPPKGTFLVWATFPTLPDQLTAFTLNNWYNWGSVPDIQLVPFYCLQGPGGGCLGIRRDVPGVQSPTPSDIAFWTALDLLFKAKGIDALMNEIGLIIAGGTFPVIEPPALYFISPAILCSVTLPADNGAYVSCLQHFHVATPVTST